VGGWAPGPCRVLVERDHELRALSAVAADVAAGGACLVLLTGPAGVGKSRLWQELVASLPEGWIAGEVGGHRTDRTPMAPFSPLLEALPDGDDEPVRTLGSALARALVARSGGGPLAFAVEDLHWLDPVAIAALPLALTELADAPVLVGATFRLGAHRPGSAHARGVAELLRHPATGELRLTGLSPRGVAEMAEAMGHALTDAQAVEVHERSGGVPLLVEELVRSSGDAAAWTVQEAVLARLPPSPVARRVASLLAVSGEPLLLSVLEDLEPGAGAELALLREASIAVLLDDGAGVTHALVGEALRSALDDGALAALHAELAAALERTPGAAPEAVARHWTAAGHPERAAPWALEAADRLARLGAFGSATELYEVALAQPPEDPLERAAAYERAVAAAVRSRADVAARWALQARRANDDAGPRWRAAGSWANRPLLQLVDPEAAAELRDTPAPDLLLRSQEATRAGDFDEARDRAVAALEAAGDDLAMRATAAISLLYAGDPDACEAVLRRLRDEARAAAQPTAVAWATVNLSRWARALGRLDEATRLDEEALACAREADDPALVAHLVATVAFIRAQRGDLAEAELLSRELLDLDDPLFGGMAQVPLAVVDLERDDAAGARARLAPLVPVVRATGNDLFTGIVLGVLARIELALGEPAVTLSHVTEAEAAMWSPFHEARPELDRLRAEAAVALGDDGELALASAGLHERSRHVDGPDVVAATAAVAGLAAATGGRDDEAAARFESAARSFERAPRWAEAADAWCAAASAAASGMPAHAVALADRAAAVARAHGLVRAGRRAEEVRTALAADSASTVPDVAGLTPRELDVLRLAADGRTNREIGTALYLSEHTVRNYLSAAFAKLGVSRRSEAAALMTRLELGKR
jgi:DNA-binding CsgD family transcriptional regulator